MKSAHATISGRRSRVCGAAFAAFSTIVLSTTALAQEKDEPTSAFVRSRSIDGVTGFDTASRTYITSDGSLPEITLVGVVHIGDAAYYDAIVAELATHDLVLYESVLPRGAFGTRGDTELARQRATQDAMLFVRNLLAQFKRANERFPADAAALRAFIVARDTRLARPIDLAFRDAWGQPISYTLFDDEFELRSLGSDGKTGGQGTALDLVLGPIEDETRATNGVKQDKPRDLYKELADALGVTLQVRSINYDRVGWEPADLPMEELLDRLWRRGERSFTLEMLSNDSGLQQGVVRFLLSLVSNSPSFKKMVVRALGQAGTRSEGALPDVDQRIILDERNEAVLDHLRMVLQSPNRPARIAIFYGAAHMPEFERSLETAFHMKAGAARWSTAMSVDEWSDTQIRERLRKFEEAHSDLLTSDANGAYPEAARIEWRMASLEKRLQARAPQAEQVAPSTTPQPIP